jgi:hypothetical protein
MRQLRNLASLVALAAAMGALGTVGGYTTRSALANEQEVDSVIGGGGCEEDECELRGVCVDNPGQKTKCSVSGTSCTTGAC